MNTNLSLWRSSRFSLMPWAATFLGAALLLSAAPVKATPPPSGTVIGNQASASYLDTSGALRSSSSNMVQVTVSQVGAYSITGNNVRSATSGSTTYVEHILTNSGNGSDTFNISVADAGTGAGAFSRIEIYADPNGTGQPSSTTPLCSNAPGATVPLCSAGYVATIAGNGGTFTFVVAYSIPPTATSGTWPHDTGTVTAIPSNTASSWYSTYSPSTASNTDLLNLAAGAAFSSSKSIAAPAVAAPGGGAWPAVIISGQASAASCAGTWTAGMNSTSSPICSYVVYTIKYTNTGTASGTYYMSDLLPAGLSYVTGSAIWSSNPGVALSETNAGNPANMNFTESLNTVTATISNVAPNVSGTLSFIALVKSTATVGTSTSTNTATFASDPTTCTGSTISTCSTGSTNPAIFTVTQSFGVVAAKISSTSTDVSDGGTAGSPPNSGNDQVLQAAVSAGSYVNFSNVITNTGNSTDTFNLVLSNPAGSLTFPSGTIFAFYKADGVTPLLDSNGDGIADTGPLAAGASVTVVVRANVPPSAGVGSGPFNTLLTASSTGAVANGVTAVPDAVWDQVTAVIGSTVDLTNTAAGISCSVSPTTCDLGPGPSTSPTTTNSTAAGTGTTFTLYVKNNDTLSNSYTFSPSSSSAFPGSLPTGWTVKFVAAGGTCASTAITTLGPIAAGAQSSVVACVTPPITATIGTQNIDFQVVSSSNSSTGGIVNDIIMDAVTVTQQIISSDTLTPSNNGQIGPGGTSVYPHTLTNTGNQSCGAFTIAANLSAADAAAGWVATVYIDTNKNGVIDSGDTLVTGTVPALAAGASTSLLIKVFAPPGITPGTVSTATITATDTVGACAVQTTTDVSTVITGQVRLMKTQVADPACGGNLGSLGALTTTTFSVRAGTCVIYQVTGTNQGVAPVANVSLSDAIPAYTTYEGATQPSTNCVSTGLSGTAIAFATTGTPVNTVSCGSTSNSLAPGGTVTTTFAVKVNQ